MTVKPKLPLLALINVSLSLCYLPCTCPSIRAIIIDDASSPSLSVTAINHNGDISHQNKGTHGDWVLFHPVYAPEELKSVEVRIPISLLEIF